jgi:hypothetical protein
LKTLSDEMVEDAIQRFLQRRGGPILSSYPDDRSTTTICEVHIVTRKTVAGGIIALGLALASSPAFADETGERRGEIGVQIGVRLADNNLIPDGDNGLAFAYGIEGAWAFNRKWALFWDVNSSNHDSPQFCAETPNCSALTPVSHHKVVTFGMERRLKQNPKGCQWVFGLGTGMMDVEWNGTQIHHGILSFNAGRRRPLGPGTLRWTFRIETSFSGRTDSAFIGALDWARLTNVVAVVGWGFDFGKRYKTPS